MKSELVVDVQSTGVSVALLEDGRLEEINQYTREKTFSVGNIYLGRVKKLMPSLNAAFVDVGYEKDAFLHYLDLGAGFNRLNGYVQSVLENGSKRTSMNKYQSLPEVGKEGKIDDYLSVGQLLLVQVSKEPINTKGPRLTAEISLAGRNIVFIPFAEKVMVSGKIKAESERSRLKQLIQSIKPNNYGVIVRTVAEGKRVAELDGELKLLYKRWEETISRLNTKKSVDLISEEIGRAIGIIRDVFNPTFESIQVNDGEVYNEVKTYIELIAPNCTNIVHLYKAEQPIFDHFNVTRQMKTGLGRTVGFKSGGYLIIERTEALFSIDVNSGSKKMGDNQEENAFNANMLAAEEIVHQLRLRDIGGIIIIDFIDLSSAEHRQALYEYMVKLMGQDRAKHNVLPLSKFGLMQITRQRVRPAVEVDVREVCPTCLGKGKVQSSLNFTEQLKEEIEAYTQKFGKRLCMYVHPYVYAYVSKGWFSSLKSQWKRHYGVKTLPDQQLGMLQYRFTDQHLKPLEKEDSKKTN